MGRCDNYPVTAGGSTVSRKCWCRLWPGKTKLSATKTITRQPPAPPGGVRAGVMGLRPGVVVPASRPG
jgi:hypothetical protein